MGRVQGHTDLIESARVKMGILLPSDTPFGSGVCVWGAPSLPGERAGTQWVPVLAL